MGRKDISPSSLARRWLCPGSYAQELGMPELQTDWSDYGRDMHKVFERIVSGVEVAKEYAQEMAIDASDKKMNEAIDWAYDTLQKDVPKKPHSIKIEHLLDLRFIGCRILEQGTADLLCYEQFGEGVLYDWKFGSPMVSDEVLAIQLKCYAVGALKEFGLTKVTACCIFPMSKKESRHVFEAQDIELYCKQIREIEARCFTEKPPLVPSKYTCSRCKALGTCEAASGVMRKVAAVSSKAVNNPDRFTEVVEYAFTADIIGNNVRSRAISMLKKGKKIAGWKLDSNKTEIPRWHPLGKAAAKVLAKNYVNSHVTPEYVFFTDGGQFRAANIVYRNLLLMMSGEKLESVWSTFRDYLDTENTSDRLVRDMSSIRKKPSFYKTEEEELDNESGYEADGN